MTARADPPPPARPPAAATPRRWSAEELAAASRAPATWRAYAADWRAFTAWAAAHGHTALPAAPDTVGAYIAAHTGRLKPMTLARRVSAIAAQHHQAGLPFDRTAPAIARVLAGARRVMGTAPQQKRPLSPDEIAAIVATLPATPTGLRDAALLLVTYAGAFRRAEVAALVWSDIRFAPHQGIEVLVRRAKADQAAEGQRKAIATGSGATCPVAALKRWKSASRCADDSGPVFRRIDRHGNLGGALSGEAVAGVIKRAVLRWALANGHSDAEARRLADSVGGHSARAGALTAGAEAGLSDHDLLAVSLHKTRAGLAPYVRRGNLFRTSLTRRLGL